MRKKRGAGISRTTNDMRTSVSRCSVPLGPLIHHARAKSELARTRDSLEEAEGEAKEEEKRSRRGADVETEDNLGGQRENTAGEREDPGEE